MSIIPAEDKQIIVPEKRGIREWIKNVVTPKIRGSYSWFRLALSKFQKKHPTGYQTIYTAALFIIDFLPAILSTTPFTGILFGILMSVAFFFGFILQGANIKNRYDAAHESDMRDAEGLLTDALNEIQDCKQAELDTSALYFDILHRISSGCNKISAKRVDPNDRFSEDLEYIANTMESYLSGFYKYKVSVNIKLMLPNMKVRTFVRGKNNINNRGGEQNVFDLNRKEIDTRSNYAFKMILDKNMGCFIEKDLSRIDTILDHDISKEFYCERQDWYDYFMSTAVFAIRGYATDRPDPYQKNYETLGFLCIDAENPTEWHISKDCMVFNFGSFCSELIYNYLGVYRQAHAEQN